MHCKSALPSLDLFLSIVMACLYIVLHSDASNIPLALYMRVVTADVVCTAVDSDGNKTRKSQTADDG